MAPQTDYEEGTSFYGAVKIAPKMEERLTNRSKTLKLLVGLAFIAVALTAAVFAFTSPVATRSVEAVIDVSPHYAAQTCFCKSDCVNEPGYGKEGVCEVTIADCVDFLGQPAATCTAAQQLLGMTAAADCAACDMVVGANSCWSNPCKNGGLCADRATTVNAVDPDGLLGYHCHCKYGWTGDSCTVPVDFCKADPQMFCDNGKRDHVCKTDDDCKYVEKANSDAPSTCTIKGAPVCHENANCVASSVKEPGDRNYLCECKPGYRGDGYEANQKIVAFGSVLKAATDDCLEITSQNEGQLSYATNADMPGTPSYGWIARECTPDVNGAAPVYVGSGCANINGCEKNCPVDPDDSTQGILKEKDCGALTNPPGACQNAATCEDTYSVTGIANTFKCACPKVLVGTSQVEVWSGDLCQKNIDECDNSGVCGTKATCTDLEPNKGTADSRHAYGFECTCNDGWDSSGYGAPNTDVVGKFLGCVDHIDCTDDTCKHGGTCTEKIEGDGSIECACLDGWTGDHCETNKNECLNDMSCLPKNHMVCEDLKQTYPGIPQEDSTTHNSQGFRCVCLNHWTWADEETAHAKTTGEYGGNKCVDYDDCIMSPCSNAATCTNNGKSVPEDWTCICASGWEGRNCDVDIDECEFVHTVAGLGNGIIDEESEVDRMHNCLDEAQCYNTDGSWNCTCMDGYFGNGVEFCDDIDDCARHQKAEFFCTTDMRQCSGEDDKTCGGVCTVDFGDGAVKTITRCEELSDCKNDQQLLNLLQGSLLDSTAITACVKDGAICTKDDKLTRDAYPRGTQHLFDAATQQVNAIATYSKNAITNFVSPAAWVRNKVVYDQNGELAVHQCGYLEATEGVVRPSWMETGNCVDTGVNSFECECNEGWTDSNCDVDVAECQLGIDNCDRNAKCKETPGSFLCECKSGYADADQECREAQTKTVTRTHEQLSRCGLSCSDIDDCIGGQGKCVHGVCRDLGASAFKCTCNVGYTDFKCDADINECGLMTDDCHTLAECTNLPGSWSCRCKEGYVGTGRGDDGCIAINDCAQSPCEHGTCTDIGNAYVCSCEDGWKDKHCDHDENECLESTASHSCHDDGKCVNTPGSYYCRCVSGYQGDGYTCMDLDDCDPDPCGMPDAKNETPLCRSPGATSKTAAYTCPDIFTADQLGCMDMGANSFQCRVCPGYSADRGTVPSDINECTDGTDLCSPNAVCSNLHMDGSHTCTCKATYYDPCICKTELRDGDICPVCMLKDSEELCVPGQVCVKCTTCGAGGEEDSSSVYACPNDQKLVDAGRAYFPADPQFNGGPPTNPGLTNGRGFTKKADSMCIHSDNICINIDECNSVDHERKSMITYNGKEGCDKSATCIDECGTVRCECTGGCYASGRSEENYKCYFGDGQTCTKCSTCEDHECEADGPTSTTDRQCVALIPDGKYAVETTSGHTAQCLVMWAESQKVFPERFNWGGESTDKVSKAQGMEVADLCENPICGVCDYSGKTAQQNILAGGSAVWVFRHLAGEEYLIMSAEGTGGYRCLGFRAPGAPYPELLTWETTQVSDAKGTCEVGKCTDGALAWSRSECKVGDDFRFLWFDKRTCSTNKDCDQGIGKCTDGQLGAACIVSTGSTKYGGLCTCVTATVDVLQCAKESSSIGMWSNTGPVGGAEWATYYCGLDNVNQVKSKKQVVWKIRALGQQSAAPAVKDGEEANPCHSAKKCSKAKYKSMFVIESMARGENYECLHFKDGDFSNQANPSLMHTGSTGGLCGAFYGSAGEEKLVAAKNAVWKLIALGN